MLIGVTASLPYFGIVEQLSTQGKRVLMNISEGFQRLGHGGGGSITSSSVWGTICSWRYTVDPVLQGVVLPGQTLNDTLQQPLAGRGGQGVVRRQLMHRPALETMVQFRLQISLQIGYRPSPHCVQRDVERLRGLDWKD
jgi:hypothetical protein